MKLFRYAAPAALALALASFVPAAAQTTTETKVTNDTSAKDGVVTQKRKVVQTRKHKTNEPKKVLGVKVGEKTDTRKTVRETTTDSAGNSSTKVKTTH